MGTSSHQVPIWPPEFVLFPSQGAPSPLYRLTLTPFTPALFPPDSYHQRTHMYCLPLPRDFRKGREFCLSCSLAHVSVPTPWLILGPQWTSVGWMNEGVWKHLYWYLKMTDVGGMLAFFSFIPPLTGGAMFAPVHLKVWVPGWRPTAWVQILALPYTRCLIWDKLLNYYQTLSSFLYPSSVHLSVYHDQPSICSMNIYWAPTMCQIPCHIPEILRYVKCDA